MFSVAVVLLRTAGSAAVGIVPIISIVLFQGIRRTEIVRFFTNYY